MDGIELEIVWSNLISIVSEQAKAMQRIAFSPIVREAGDLANALFDRRGRMVAQAVTGTPGHINSLGRRRQAFRRGVSAQTLGEGDVLITNDPWLSAGHFFDITVLVPAFHKGKLVGLFRLDHPSHRYRRLWRRRRGARRARRGPVDSACSSSMSAASPTRCCTRSSAATCARRTSVRRSAAQVSSGKLAGKRLLGAARPARL